MEWTFEELQVWDEKIVKLAKKYNLDWFPIDYEVCDYHDMIGYMSYIGMPTHYQHWSYGKSFERTHTMYNLGMEGLPYEMIINSDPSISYLMSENPLALQVLIMAHCVGHSDFFKNNRMFKHTDAANVIARFRNAAKRIKKYSDNPHIGVDAVEKAIDACHALKYHNYREFGINRKSHEEIRQGYVDIANFKPEQLPEDFNINKIPLEPDYDILGFIAKHSRNLEPWQRDIINIVREESMYFMPQAMTKIMNEGWASFWHYKIMSEMDLPQEFHLSFLKFHNQVLRPMVGKINPYHLGFTIFKWIEKNKGLEECFIARASHNDESFIRTYLNKDICEDLNLFSYSKKKKEWTIDDISDEDGWKQIRADLIKNVGLNSLPNIYIRELQKDQTLVLEHEHDGRDLDLDYAHNVCDHLLDLWGDDFKFYTIIEEEPFEI